MDQVSAPSSNGAGRTSNIATFAIEAADPLACVSTAKYMLQVTDGIHLKAPGYRILGEYIGRAISAMQHGGGWTGCRITAAVLVGSTVEVTVAVPSGNLVRDTVQVPAAVNDGFRYFDDSSSVSLTGVTIGATVAGQCIVTLQLSGPPMGPTPASPTPMALPLLWHPPIMGLSEICVTATQRLPPFPPRWPGPAFCTIGR